jgi:hypothetical protein
MRYMVYRSSLSLSFLYLLDELIQHLSILFLQEMATNCKVFAIVHIHCKDGFIAIEDLKGILLATLIDFENNSSDC